MFKYPIVFCGVEDFIVHVGSKAEVQSFFVRFVLLGIYTCV